MALTSEATSANGGLALRPHALTLQALLDRSALQHMVLTYCHGIDRRDYALVRSLYHDDAIDDHGAMFCGTPDEYIAWLPTMLANWSATAHVIHNSLFIVDGDHAEGESAVTAFHRTADNAREIIAHGRYLDQCKRRDGAWRFYRRSLVLDWSEERATPEGFGEGVVLGQASTADPSYLRLPFFALQRGVNNAPA